MFMLLLPCFTWVIATRCELSFRPTSDPSIITTASPTDEVFYTETIKRNMGLPLTPLNYQLGIFTINGARKDEDGIGYLFSYKAPKNRSNLFIFAPTNQSIDFTDQDQASQVINEDIIKQATEEIEKNRQPSDSIRISTQEDKGVGLSSVEGWVQNVLSTVGLENPDSSPTIAKQIQSEVEKVSEVRRNVTDDVSKAMKRWL